MEKHLLKKATYTRGELVAMYGQNESWHNLKMSIERHPILTHKLTTLGYTHNAKGRGMLLTKTMVVEIFKAIGAPDGYEHYENANTAL